MLARGGDRGVPPLVMLQSMKLAVLSSRCSCPTFASLSTGARPPAPRLRPGLTMEPGREREQPALSSPARVHAGGPRIRHYGSRKNLRPFDTKLIGLHVGWGEPLLFARHRGWRCRRRCARLETERHGRRSAGASGASGSLCTAHLRFSKEMRRPESEIWTMAW